ncbi:YitT family protein [Algicella marina]|uniref:YitT family protein n=2 Tax=Algicella marina TaxID=2683284 RepID=A0A6P1T7Y0_9RHOB|nr:YitT family protein [Algicella marina]
MKRLGDWSSTATHHSPVEDAQGIAAAVVLTALGVAMLAELGLVTSGLAGLALIGHEITGLSIGLLFFVLNAPFYAFALLQMGAAFTAKTVAAVVAFSVVVDLQERFVAFERIAPVYGAIVAGVLIGIGLLAVFRHRASLGGVGILAVWLQDRYGFRAGWTQMIYDFMLFLLALAVLPLRAVAFSFLSALVLNLFLAINHRTDRYIAR